MTRRDYHMIADIFSSMLDDGYITYDGLAIFAKRVQDKQPSFNIDLFLKRVEGGDLVI